MEQRAEEIQEGAPASSTGSPHLNSRRAPQGGGRIVERKKFINKSALTGKDPDELIREHQSKDG